MNKFTKAIAAIMLMMVFTVSCNKPDEPNNGGNNNGQNDTIVDNSGSFNGHDYIDLGLPSGTLWATCNVGAEAPEEYGDYFAWGETEPKEIYDWSTYKYAKGDYDQLTKYCQNATYGYEGYTDALYVLESLDDAATVNWGDGWRMPSATEGEELLSQCSHQRDTVNGVPGLRIVGTNGNSIFMPASGAKGDFLGSSPESLEVGHSGYYWVNARNHAFNNYMVGDYDYVANFISFPVVYSVGGWTYRSVGMSVRAVCTAQ